MKTSKIIFISFFSFIGLLLLSFLIVGFAYKDAGIKDKKKRAENFKNRTKTIKIEKQFKHILIEDKGSITVKHGEEQALKYFAYNSKDSLIAPELDVKNDTLFLNAQDRLMIVLTLKDLNKLKSIVGINSTVVLSGIEMSNLDLNFKGGRINLTDNTKIKNISVILSEKSEYSTHYNVVVDSLNLDINNSKINFYNRNSNISLLKGTINNNSNVQITKAFRINLEVDKSSRLNMW